VFAAGYVTSDSVVRDNLCVNNALSPRLAALQGAVYLHTWNGGVIRGLRIEHNTFIWNPPVSTAAALVDDAGSGGMPVVFTGNRIESAAPRFYRANAQFAPSANTYRLLGSGDARFTLGGRQDSTLAALQAAGFEEGTTLDETPVPTRTVTSLRLEATVDFALDSEALLAPGPRAQLMVLRSLAEQYGAGALAVTVHLHTAAHSSAEQDAAEANALLDLNAESIRFDFDAHQAGELRLLTTDGRVLQEWSGFQNAATLGGAVRARLGAPRFAAMPATQTKGLERPQ
jgi:hypothetical protein